MTRIGDAGRATQRRLLHVARDPGAEQGEKRRAKTRRTALRKPRAGLDIRAADPQEALLGVATGPIVWKRTDAAERRAVHDVRRKRPPASDKVRVGQARRAVHRPASRP